MKFYTMDQMVDKHVGKSDTPERKVFDAEIEAALIGASIKEARLAQNLTQSQLGEKIGVQCATVSKIENGRNLTITTIVKILNALSLTADFRIKGLAPITLGAR